MHYHCEIILPPTDSVEEDVAAIMAQFDENGSTEDGERNYGFWDWYVIGGRWAGNKLMASYDQEKLKEFRQWCQDEKLTVSGVVCGKQELNPPSQIEKVDAKWNEMFPSEGAVMVACPMFQHSNDQYGRDGDGTIPGDICKLADATTTTCSRVIFAGRGGDKLEATFMLSEGAWNGVNFMGVKWDGTVADALGQFKTQLSRYSSRYRARIEPHDDWLCVTVDYHS